MLRSIVLACSAALIGPGGAWAAKLYPVPDGAARIDIALPALADADEVQIQYSGFWHREDYARFTSPWAQAEIVYAAADPHENAALEVSLPFTRARDSFAVNARGEVAPGGMGRLDQPQRTVFFQPYALKDRGWVCVAVKSEWDHVARDPRNRPGRVMFGYICDKRGGVLTPARAETMAQAIVTRGAEVNWRGNGPALAGPTPMGNSRFPFRFGVHFNDHDSDNRGR